jgi:hypothetical protein
MDLMSNNAIVLPGLLQNHASDALFTSFSEAPYTDLSNCCSL